MATEKFAIVSTRIGHGTQTHISEATLEGDKLVPMLVGCGVGFRNGMVTGHHGTVQVSELYETETYETNFLARQATRLKAYNDFLAKNEDIFLCERCVKSIGRTVKFLTKQQAEKK